MVDLNDYYRNYHLYKYNCDFHVVVEVINHASKKFIFSHNKEYIVQDMPGVTLKCFAPIHSEPDTFYYWFFVTGLNVEKANELMLRLVMNRSLVTVGTIYQVIYKRKNNT